MACKSGEKIKKINNILVYNFNVMSKVCPPKEYYFKIY